MATEWWRGAIIYQLYPRSFFDAKGDGIGDLTGITEKLDYIGSLGVDAIWISPFFKSPMRDFGYDVADYRLVDPIFGTNQDFARLLAAAHERDLKIIIDLVLAHTSDEHPWFKESRSSRENAKADWYVWAEAKPDGTPPNNWLSVFGGSAWHWDSRHRQYYLHHYLRSQPNLNWHNPEVLDAVFGEIRYWLDAGVDGFRLDAITTLAHDNELRDNPVRGSDPGEPPNVGEINNPFFRQQLLYTRDQPRTLEILEQLRSLCDTYDDRYLIGEIADVDLIAVSAKYTRTGKHLHSCYNFALMQPVFSCSFLRAVIEKTESVLGSGWTTWAMSNHDNVRVVTRWGQMESLQGDDRSLAALLLVTLLCLRGGACIYQGEELGLTEAEVAYDDLQDPWGIEFWPDFKGRDGCRTPMPWSSESPNAGFSKGRPWLPVPAEHLALAVERQEETSNSVLQKFRQFTQWRKQHAALVRGQLAMVEAKDPVLAFERVHESERFLCVFNFSNRTVSQPMTDNWEPLEVIGSKTTLEKGNPTLPPFGFWFGKA
jgi:alpha-glucosidase